MKQVISAKDVEELLRQGGNLSSLPADALYTPSARDLMRQHGKTAPAWSTRTPGSDSKPAAASAGNLEAFFNSPAIHALKLEICDIGRRLWQRD